MKYPELIAVTGPAGVGKDTIYKLLRKFLLPFGVSSIRISIGDSIRNEMDDFLKYRLGISAWTANREEKDVIRPLLVEYGRVKRFKFGADYWAKQLQPEIDLNVAFNRVSVITDFRYFDFEYDWIRSHKSFIIYLERDGVNHANSDEAENNPKIRANADMIIKVPFIGIDDLLFSFLRPHFEKMLTIYGEKEAR